MKKVLLPGLLIIPLVLPFICDAQWTDIVNNNINFEIRIKENYYNGDNDFDGYADPAVLTYIGIVNSNINYDECIDWDCSAPCSYTNFSSHDGVVAEDMPFDTRFFCELSAHESDATNNECTYQSGDDHGYFGEGNLRGGGKDMLVVYPSTDFFPANWNHWLADGGIAWLYPGSSVWDQQLESTWRYTHGDEFSDPLSFDTIGHQQTKADINSNRIVPDQTYQTDLNYEDLDNSVNSSPDVYYSFTITSVATVTISTDHAETGFDTYLKLFDGNGDLLAEDDDGGSGGRSVITKSLCAGTYIFMVEGYGPYTGVYKASVEAEYHSNQPTISPNITHVSCPGAMDGLVIWGISGGLTPYTRLWDNNASNGVEENLGIGSYVAYAEDACGTFTGAFIDIENGDSIKPVANCISYIDVTVSGSNTTSVAPASLDNGSTDNCGITQTILTPSLFTAANAGINDCIFTVYDANGNTDTCAVTVNVQLVTGIEEDNHTAELVVYPNPSKGYFTIDLSGTAISKDASIIVINNLGQIVFSTPITQDISNIDLSMLSSGIYRCVLQSHKGTASTELAIIR